MGRGALMDSMSHKALTTAPGSGLPCDECHKPIDSDQVECRCPDMNPSSATPLRFHQWCHYARSRRGP
jgi:hypothetical protein